MSSDQDKTMQAVERLLKLGKVQAALAELERLTRSAPNDLLTLNRLADLLARQGRHAEAIDSYTRIAERFAQGGFFPKAIAIYKKVLRLNPQHAAAIVQLGEMYLNQRLLGEARGYLLKATEIYLHAKDFERARQVCERLVRAEPGEARHRVRLAETLVALGRASEASEGLADLAAGLLGAGKATEAEKIYRRCMELEPGRPEPLLGLVRALVLQERGDEAIFTLEQACSGASVDPQLLGELGLRYVHAGRTEAALVAMEHPAFVHVPGRTVQQLFRLHAERGDLERAWERLKPLLDTAGDASDPQPLALFLEALAEVDEQGHVPALQRLYELQKRIGDRAGTIRALEWLVRAYQARAMHDEASLMLDQLRELTADSPLLASSKPAPDAARSAATPAASPETAGPAVPRGRADDEFVSGRLTQAEILEKYGLRQKALEQLEEITGRFPGHVGAQEKRVSILRGLNGVERELAAALAGLGAALLTAGDPVGARESARDAAAIPQLDPAARGMLVDLELIEAAEESEPDVELQAPATGRASAPEEVLIEFDGAPAAVEPLSSPAPRAAVPPRPRRPVTRPPTPDMLEEIKEEIAHGQLDSARRRVDALRVLGFASPDLERLGATLAPGPSAPAPPPLAAPAIPPRAVFSADDVFGLADDELSAITAALEQELGGASEVAAIEPAAAEEESIDDIFAAFKKQVQQEVGEQDYRTHYDLGIAYKEMGLTDEAIEEFELVARSSAFQREACSMIALCQRERNDLPQAARWYRAALDSPGGDAEARTRLRYDLAEVLLQTGDAEGALDLFRDVLRADPGFREVGSRIRDLEAQLQS